MNNDKHELPPVEAVPSPQLPAAEITYGTVPEASQAQALEKGKSSSPPNDPPASVPANNPLMQQPLQPVTDNTQTASTGIASPAAVPIADDSDLIEKEWVERAKNIVTQTRNDPYSQNKELTKLKADYLLKRYNKEIKLNND